MRKLTIILFLIIGYQVVYAIGTDSVFYEPMSVIDKSADYQDALLSRLDKLINQEQQNQLLLQQIAEALNK